MLLALTEWKFTKERSLSRMWWDYSGQSIRAVDKEYLFQNKDGILCVYVFSFFIQHDTASSSAVSHNRCSCGIYTYTALLLLSIHYSHSLLCMLHSFIVTRCANVEYQCRRWVWRNSNFTVIPPFRTVTVLYLLLFSTSKLICKKNIKKHLWSSFYLCWIFLIYKKLF